MSSFSIRSTTCIHREDNCCSGTLFLTLIVNNLIMVCLCMNHYYVHNKVVFALEDSAYQYIQCILIYTMHTNIYNASQYIQCIPLCTVYIPLYTVNTDMYSYILIYIVHTSMYSAYHHVQYTPTYTVYIPIYTAHINIYSAYQYVECIPTSAT